MLAFTYKFDFLSCHLLNIRNESRKVQSILFVLRGELGGRRLKGSRAPLTGARSRWKFSTKRIQAGRNEFRFNLCRLIHWPSVALGRLYCHPLKRFSIVGGLMG